MATCPCDNLPDDTCLSIEPGLTTLPRQSRGFAEVKAGLLASVAAQPVLNGWTAEAEQDLGVMLLDMWSYVQDITQFYDAKITDEFFLGTAKRDISTHRIIQLLGYKPRPALSAALTLAAQIDGPAPLTLPEGAGFRSEAFGDEKPQIFQTLTPQTLYPERNTWQVEPVEDTAYPGRILLRPGENGVPKRGVLAFALDGTAHHASPIAGVGPHIGADGRRMVEITLDTALPVPEGTQVDQIKTRLMGLSAGPSPLNPAFEVNTLFLDSIYPQLRANDLAVLETEGQYFAFRIEQVERADLELTTSSTVPITTMASKVTLPAIPGLFLTGATEYRLHFHPIRVGKLRAPYKTELSQGDLDPAGLERPKHKQDGPLSGDFILHGAANAGELRGAQVTQDPQTKDISLALTAGQPEFDTALKTPVNLLGNLITVVRGEQVSNEILGTADAASPVNRFQLKKSPLSWIEDASQTSGIRPLLEVRVDQIEWQRVDTLYTARPDDRVYTLETDVEDKTWVVFGDGEHGQRPTGNVGGITASYRHGAGAAKPPPGTIKQTQRPIKGLGKVMNPLSATGGADAEASDQIRTNAPSTVLALGRAVSVQDFTALARTYPGVLNVASGWAWHPQRQRAVVTIWVAEDGGLDQQELQSWLIGMAATDTPVVVELATPIPHSLTVSLDIEPDHPKDDTQSAALATLADPETGLLALGNVPIGGVLYRSAIVKALQVLPGVASVSALMLNGAEMDWAFRVSAGSYADFSNAITVA